MRKGTLHSETEAKEIFDVLVGLHESIGAEQLRQMSLGDVAEILMQQGDRPAGTWIFANRTDWYEFLRTNVLEIRVPPKPHTIGSKPPPRAA